MGEPAAAGAVAVVIVDDQDAVRRGTRMLLALEPDISVIGEAASGAEAVAVTMELRPDVVVMDVVMEDGGGLEATQTIRDRNAGVAIILVSIHDDLQTRQLAARAGAAAFVSKHEVGMLLVPTIHSVTPNRRG